jgi:tRNA threonylcarbamoyladenosine biosynthesis protein TsaB
MILSIDTASEITRLALLDKDMNVIAKKEWHGGFSQSETLLLEIDSLLANNNFSVLNLKKIIVNVGPGSYTGVRIGVTTANFLAFVLNINIEKKGDLPKDVAIPAEKKIFLGPVMPFYAKKPFITKPKPRL